MTPLSPVPITIVHETPAPIAVSVQPPGPELLSQSQEWVDVAKSYAIAIPEARVAASEDMRRCKQLKRDIVAQCKSMTAPIDLAKSRILEFFREPIRLLDVAILSIDLACNEYDREQDRLRRVALAEAARIADEERRRLIAKAATAEKAGDVETAHVLASAAAVVAPAPVAAAPKIVGEVSRETWHAEVDDLRALARAVADGLIAAENIMPNMPVLNKQAVALKGALSIPGVRAASTISRASKAIA